MGSLIEKAEYLQEAYDTLFSGWLADSCPYTDIKERMQWVRDYMRLWQHFMASDRDRTDRVKVTYADGTSSYIALEWIGNPDMSIYVLPKTIVHGSVLFPFGISAKGAGAYLGQIHHIDLSNIVFIKDVRTPFLDLYVQGPPVSSLILSEYFRLQYHAFYVMNTNDIDSMFDRGLKLGRVAEHVSSSWLSKNIATERYVDCMDNFEGDMYLSRISMSAETMVRLFTKLKDLTATGEEYTFNVGTTNLAKLTEEQKAIATNKGWKLT